MRQTALVTGADRGLGLALTERLLQTGWSVIAGQYLDWPELDRLSGCFGGALVVVPLDVSSIESACQAARQAASRAEVLDLLIANAGIIAESDPLNIRQGLNYGDMAREYEVNALGVLRTVEAFLPLMDKSPMKRVCIVSSEAGSIGACDRTDWYGYCMSKAALNMAARILHNDLSRQGFEVRLYHPGWMRTYMHGDKNLEAHLEPEEAAELALKYFLADGPQPFRLHCWDGADMAW